MESNPTFKTNNTPSVQPSIRSFFQRRTPNYATPPRAQASKAATDGSTISKLNKPPVLSSPSSKDKKAGTTSHPAQASISSIDEKHVQPLRRINSLLLPINYPDSFYHKILEPKPPANFSRVVLWTDPPSSEPRVIGGVVCRLDPAPASQSLPSNSPPSPGNFDIYIQSLVLLSPYRHKGLATCVLANIITSAISQHDVFITSLYAHVWTENTEALEWYAARGFQREEPLIHGYYRKLKPDTAWILRRRLDTSDHLAHSSPIRLSRSLEPQNTTSIPPLIPRLEPTTPSPTNSMALPRSPVHTSSFQDRRPDVEWNDLPDEVTGSFLKLPNGSSKAGSATSSRSSSRSGLEGKWRKKRQYPAAAFGGS